MSVNPTDDEFAEKIQYECWGGDQELNHCRADELLIQLLRRLGYDRTANAFESVEKWYA